MAPAAALAALESLATTPPRVLLSRDSRGGPRCLEALYKECVAAGLVSGRTPCPEYELDDVKRLHALFDVSLCNGLACVIVDYVNEVCRDAYAVSSDAFEARLMETEMVQQWCADALERSAAEVCTGPRSQPQSLRPLADLDRSNLLRAQASKLSGLTAVLQALRGDSEGGQSPRPKQQLHQLGSRASSKDSELTALSESAECLRQGVAVAKWCAEAGLGSAPPSGHYGSHSEWAMRYADRAQAAASRSASGKPFLSDLCRDASALHLSNKYPSGTLEDFLGGLFLCREEAPAGSRAFQERLGVLLYYLEDSGNITAAELGAALRRGFHLSPANIAQWRSAFLLDSCSGADGPCEGRVREASALLLGTAVVSTPFKYAEVLSRGFGDHSAALALLRTGAGAGCRLLSHALAAMDVRLACGLLPEAFLEAERHCRALEPGNGCEEQREALVRHLLEWAQRNKALHRVLELALAPCEEAVLHKCLQQGVGGASRSQQRMLLPVYYLQRGRTTEAMICAANTAAHQDGADALAGRAASTNAVHSCTAHAGRLLPLAQRQLISSGAASAAAAEASSAPSGPRRAVEVLRCSQPPAGAFGAQLDGVAVLQSLSSTAGTPALLGPLLQHWSKPAASAPKTLPRVPTGPSGSPSLMAGSSSSAVAAPKSPLLFGNRGSVAAAANPGGITAMDTTADVSSGLDSEMSRDELEAVAGLGDKSAAQGRARVTRQSTKRARTTRR